MQGKILASYAKRIQGSDDKTHILDKIAKMELRNHENDAIFEYVKL